MITFREKEFSEYEKEFSVRPALKSSYKVMKSIFKPKGTSMARKIVSANNKVTEGIGKANSLALNPGAAVKNASGLAIERPITSATYVTGTYASNGLAPMGSISAALQKAEGAAYKKIGVDKKLSKVSRKFKEGRAGRAIEVGTNAVINTLKNTPALM